MHVRRYSRDIVVSFLLFLCCVGSQGRSPTCLIEFLRDALLLPRCYSTRSNLLYEAGVQIEIIVVTILPVTRTRFVRNMLSQYLWISLLFAVVYLFYSSDHHREILLKFFKESVNVAQTFFLESNDELTPKTEFSSSESLFTKNDLKRYNNLNDGLYLSVLGEVYDVTEGEKHYGKGAAYNAFVGRDASLAFVTGDFTEKGLIDDISSLSVQQTKDLYGWIQFYKDNYIYKGKLIGRYYNEDGSSTSEYDKYHEKLKIADQEKSKEEEKKLMFPPCNIEWKPDVGTRVWCTKRSGGIERPWIGVPRMFYENPGSSNYRCACVNIQSQVYNENKGSLREYPGCPEGSTHCTIKQTEDTV